MISNWLPTEVHEVGVLDVSDVVEASVEMGGVLGQGGDLFQVGVITIHTPSNTHTQQAGRHTCT